MSTALRRLAGRARAAFTRLDRLFALRSSRPASRLVRPRLEVTPLEERVVLDATVSVARVADGAEGGAAGTFRFTRADDPAAIAQTALTVAFKVGGTATAGADYTLPGASVSAPAPGQAATVTFAPGQSTLDLAVPVADDALAEGWESVSIELQPPSGPQPPGSYYTVVAGPATAWIADNELWLETDADPVLKGREVTFWLPEDGPEFTSVEWDTNYDGVTFDPAPGATGWWLATTFDAVGSRTVAARATPVGGAAQIVTLDVAVENPPPVVTVPDDMTVAVATPVVLEAAATAEAGVASVAWSFSYWSDDYGWDFETDPSLTTLDPTYVFEWAGEYDVQVVVTDNDGKSAEGWFHVTVTNAAPTATATASGPIREGETATFTVNELDPDALDTVTVYADWYGSGEFVQLNGDDFAANPDGSVTFAHRYLDSPAGGSYAVTLRVEDEWGLSTDYTATVVVNDVPPPFTFSAGNRVATRDGFTAAGVDVWVLTAGSPLAFDMAVLDPEFGESNPSEAAEYEFHWKIGDEEFVTDTPTFALPDYTAGEVYQVSAWVTDGESVPGDPPPPVVVVVDGGYDRDGVRSYSAIPAISFFGTAIGGIYGTLSVEGGDAGVTSGRNAYGRNQSITKEDWGLDTPATVRFQLADVTAQLAQAAGAQVQYQFRVQTFDVEKFSFGPDNFILLSDTTTTTASNSIQIPGLEDDREVRVTVEVQFVVNGQVIRDSFPYWFFGTQYENDAPPTATLITPKSPTTLQWITQTVESLQALYDLAPQFGAKAGVFLQALADRGPEHVFNVLAKGFGDAVEQFVTDLPNTFMDKVYAWLLGPSSGTLSGFAGADWSDPQVALSFVLNYAGLTWDHVYEVVRQQLGAGNLAAVEEVAKWFEGTSPDPKTMNQFLESIAGKVEGISYASIKAEVEAKVKDVLKDGLGKLGVQLAAKFVPGAGAVLSLVSGLNWLNNNRNQVTDLFDKFLSSMDDLLIADEGAAAAAVKGKLLQGMNAAVPVFLGFAASQFGLGTLPQRIRAAVEFVPRRVDEALRAAVSKLAAGVAGAVPGGTAGGLFDGRLAAAKEFAYQGKTYVLWAAQDKAGTKVKVAEKGGPGGYTYIGELDARSFDGTAPVQHINALASAARALHAASKQRPQPGAAAANPLPNLKALQQAVAAAEDVVVADILASACKALNAGCFAAGTKLLTRRGWVAVEEIGVGDEVASRSELDPRGAVEWKGVEATFRRTGRILHLHFPGGELVRTTPEHPFWVEGTGWTPAGALAAGDRVATLSGEWVAVAEAYDTEQWEPVYNLRVADHHTYFVGEDTWGFSAWAHNIYLSAAEVSGRHILRSGRADKYVSEDWSRTVPASGQARAFPTREEAKAKAEQVNALSNALFDALHAQDARFTRGMADGLFIKYGQGYKGDFGGLEGGEGNEDEREITTGRDGLYFALTSAPSNGTTGGRDGRPRLSPAQAQAAFDAVNQKLGLTGDARWEAPRPQTDAAIEGLRPTNRPGGYDLPAAQNPHAAEVLNEAHKRAAQYERVLAYQVHRGGGAFGAGQVVIWWGDTIGSNGSADAISIDPVSGQVTLWDSKAYTNGAGAIQSKTFTEPGRRTKAVQHARDVINAFAWTAEDTLPGGLRDKARASLADASRSYKMITVRYKAEPNNFVPLHLTPTPA